MPWVVGITGTEAQCLLPCGGEVRGGDGAARLRGSHRFDPAGRAASGRVREPSGEAVFLIKGCFIEFVSKLSILDMIGLNPDEFGSALEQTI